MVFDDALTNEVDGVYIPSPVTDVVVEENREYISAAEKTVPCEPVMKTDMEAITVQELQTKYLERATDVESDKLDDSAEAGKIAVVTQDGAEVLMQPEQQEEEDFNVSAETGVQFDERLNEEEKRPIEELVVTDDDQREDTQAVEPSVTVESVTAKTVAAEQESICVPQTVDETSIVLQEEEKEMIESLPVEVEETTTVSPETGVEVQEIKHKILEPEEFTDEILSHTQVEVTEHEEVEAEQLSTRQETVQDEMSLIEVEQITDTQIEQFRPQKIAEDVSPAAKSEEVQETQKEMATVKEEMEEADELLDVTTVTDTQAKQVDSWKDELEQTPEELLAQEPEAEVELKEEAYEQTQYEASQAEQLVEIRAVEAQEVEDVTTVTETEIVTVAASEVTKSSKLQPEDARMVESSEEPQEEMVTEVQETTTIAEAEVVVLTQKADVESYKPMGEEVVKEIPLVEEVQREVEQPAEIDGMPLAEVHVEEQVESSEAEAPEAAPVVETDVLTAAEKDTKPYRPELEVSAEEILSPETKEIGEPKEIIQKPLEIEIETAPSTVIKEIETSTFEGEQTAEEIASVHVTEAAERAVETDEQILLVETEEALQADKSVEIGPREAEVKDITAATDTEIVTVAANAELEPSKPQPEERNEMQLQHEEEPQTISQEELVTEVQETTTTTITETEVVVVTQKADVESYKPVGEEAVEEIPLVEDAQREVEQPAEIAELPVAEEPVEEKVESSEAETTEVGSVVETDVLTEIDKGMQPHKREPEVTAQEISPPDTMEEKMESKEIVEEALAERFTETTSPVDITEEAEDVTVTDQQTPATETEEELLHAYTSVEVTPVEAAEVKETEIMAVAESEMLEHYRLQPEEETMVQIQHETAQEPQITSQEEQITNVQETTTTTITETEVVVLTQKADVESYKPVREEAVEEIPLVEEVQGGVEQPTEIAEMPVAEEPVEEAEESEATEAAPVVDKDVTTGTEKATKPYKLEPEVTAEETSSFMTTEEKVESREGVQEPLAGRFEDESSTATGIETIPLNVCLLYTSPSPRD